MQMLVDQKDLFQLPEDISYLNCAYMSPMLKTVTQAGIEGISLKSDPSKIYSEDFFELSDDLRGKFSSLVNLPDPGRVAIIPAVSYGIANVVNNLRITQGREIVLAGEQFPSNVYPWMRKAAQTDAVLRIIDAPVDFHRRGANWNDALLKSITTKTAVVALPIYHWADGTKIDIQAISEKAKSVEAALIIDGTQSIGAVPFDWQKIRPDALICAGYKWLLGPYSLGLACYGERFDNGVPIEENWINRMGSEDFAGLVDFKDEYQPGALRYEVGEHSNFILVPMLLAAIKQLIEWGPHKIEEYCKSLASKSIENLAAGGFQIDDEDHRGHHLFGIRIPDSLDINEVRKGLENQKIFVSIRGKSIRVSPHVYNTRDDLEKLAGSLLAMASKVSGTVSL